MNKCSNQDVRQTAPKKVYVGFANWLAFHILRLSCFRSLRAHDRIYALANRANLILGPCGFSQGLCTERFGLDRSLRDLSWPFT